MDVILKLLSENARLKTKDVAVMAGKTEEETRAIMAEYEKAGVIKGYHAIIDWEKTERQLVRAIIEINVSPKRDHGFEEIAERVARFNEVESVYLMSGGYDLAAIVSGKTFQEVAKFVSHKLSPLESVLSTSTHFVLRTYKESGVAFCDDETDERGERVPVIRYDDLLSGRVKDLKPSGIRKFFDVANEMDGVISLGVGEPDFKTPWSIREAGIYSLEKGRTWYTANAGLPELRREIAAYLDRRFHLQYEPKTEIMVTVGGSEGIDACIRALCDEGDEVLIPEPCFVSYDPCTRLCGAVPVPVRLKAENQFKLTPADLEGKITPRTKALILPFPNNPTGAVMRREDLEPLADFLRDKNIIVLSDEIYSELTYDGTHVSIAELPGMKERTVVINGFSKSYAMTGWRLGYACGPREIIGQMYKIHQFAIMCAPTTSQFAAIEAVKNCDGEIAAMREEYDMRRRLITAGFNELGLETFTPEGAFYIFPCIKSTGLTSDEFCEKLLYSQRVAVVPGTAFGESGEGYVRVSYSYSVDHIKTALERVAQFLESL